MTPGCCSVSQLQHNFKFSSVFYPLHRSGIMYTSAVHWNTNELTQQAENDQHPLTNKTFADFRNTHQPSVVGRLMPKSPTQTVCALMSYNRCFYSNNPPLSVCDVHWSQWRSLEGRALSPPPRPRLCCYFKAVIHNVVECILFKFQSLFFPPFHSPFHIELLILLSLQCNYYNNIRCIIVDVRIFQLCGCNVSRCTDDFNWSHFCLRTCNIYCTSHAMMYLAFYSSRLVFFNLMQDSILFFTMDVCWQIFIDCMLVCWSFSYSARDLFYHPNIKIRHFV